ncbi:hypothetical protein [Streptomyces sp. NBC_00342]|uniref:hypothetical protein n=1 Tax=Streptomyces sp. NBC_00342 TaxID=2975718 RepID=UPI002E2CD3A3|nr:hypothetical protein [Streptomyces sp. NBC_00342]
MVIPSGGGDDQRGARLGIRCAGQGRTDAVQLTAVGDADVIGRCRVGEHGPHHGQRALGKATEFRAEPRRQLIDERVGVSDEFGQWIQSALV